MSEPDPRGVSAPRTWGGRRSGAGRQPVAEPGSRVTVWLPVSLHDKLIKLSAREQESVSSTTRQLLILQLK